jgi:hypothetical protein
MDKSRVFRWQNYEMLCSAKDAGVGRFAPSVVISKLAWPSRPREIAVARGNYTSEETAIDAAHAEGVRWIRDYG